MTTERDLIQRLTKNLDHLNRLYNVPDQSALVEEFLDFLAQPEPEDPTDEELLCIAAEAIDGYGNCGIKPGEYEEVTEQAVEDYGSELIAYARAVLARWGNHPANPDSSLQPIPVSERMPEPVPLSKRPWEREEWCDEQGRCWWFDSADPGWVFDTPETCRHWASFVLPAHALPLPTHE